MNNKRRDMLKSAYNLLDRAEDIIENAVEEEEDCLDNMPENLADSERCEKMESAIQSLEEALSNINSAKEYLEDASL